jgi:hypothetical protein
MQVRSTPRAATEGRSPGDNGSQRSPAPTHEPRRAPPPKTVDGPVIPRCRPGRLFGTPPVPNRITAGRRRSVPRRRRSVHRPPQVCPQIYPQMGSKIAGQRRIGPNESLVTRSPPRAFVNARTEPFRANVIHTNPQASTGSYPQRWTTSEPVPHRCGQSLGKSMWTDTQRDKVVHRLWTAVDFLLKVLGTTGPRLPRVVHRAGDKPGGYPVDIRWTAVDNHGRAGDCGRRRGFIPWLPTGHSPVDNLLTSANASFPQFAQHR